MSPTRKRKCKACGSPFMPSNSLQAVCWNALCAISYGHTLKRRQDRKAKAEGRKRLMTRRDYIKKAQAAVNRYVRARDYGLPCISCGAIPAQRFGGAMDAGHFRSTGSAPHLRFYTLQIAAQCVRCNRHLAGNAIEYRRGLIVRVGIEKVQAIEAMQGEGKWSVDYLKRLDRLMKRKAARLEKRHAM